MVAEHTVKAFDEDMTRLRGLVAEMGGLAELSIAEAMDALVSGNEVLAAGVIAHDSVSAMQILVASSRSKRRVLGA